MKKLIGVLISISIMGFAPAFALAKDNGKSDDDNERGVTLTTQVNVNAGVNVGERERGSDDGTSSEVEDEGDSEDDARGSATSTPWMRGEKEGIEKHYGTTTPPGFMSDEERDDRGVGENVRGGFAAFLNWLFGLPATTTVGDIRAQVEATSSASANAQAEAPAPVANFLQRLFGRIGSFFGGGD